MLILNLQLVTSDLAAQREFYTRVFDCPLLSDTSDKIEFQVGASRLTFLRCVLPVTGPYHFAFNIPENQFVEATQWLRQHVALISDETGRELFYSDGWNAHMVYFYDPAGNIVELIARHTLPSTSQQPFRGQSLLGISEIGIAAQNVPEQAAAIAARGNTSVYRGAGSDTFSAVGDEHGLFIVVKPGRIWFPTTDKAAQPLPITVITHSDTEHMTWRFPQPEVMLMCLTPDSWQTQ